MSKIKRFIEKVRKVISFIKSLDDIDWEPTVEKPEEVKPTPTEPEAVPTPTQPPSNETLDNFKCEWVYGGFNGSRATEDPSVQITDLKVYPEKLSMTYEWVLQLGKLWGLEYSEPGALSCLFYKKGGRWLGGKHDWISASRTSRDLKNIQSGYGGWNWAEFSHSREFAFCIASKDGKKRSNFIFYSK